MILSPSDGRGEDREWCTRLRFVKVQRKVSCRANVNDCRCGVVATAGRQSNQFNRLGQNGFRGVDIGLAGFSILKHGPILKRPNELGGAFTLVQEGLIHRSTHGLGNAHFSARARKRLDCQGFLSAASRFIGGRDKHFECAAIHLVPYKFMNR